MGILQQTDCSSPLFSLSHLNIISHLDTEKVDSSNYFKQTTHKTLHQSSVHIQLWNASFFQRNTSKYTIAYLYSCQCRATSKTVAKQHQPNRKAFDV